jgi:hypothetical protein
MVLQFVCYYDSNTSTQSTDAIVFYIISDIMSVKFINVIILPYTWLWIHCRFNLTCLFDGIKIYTWLYGVNVIIPNKIWQNMMIYN